MWPFVLCLAALTLSGCDTLGGGEERINCEQDDVLMPLCAGNTWGYGGPFQDP